jgi:hypothetical protein
LQTVTGFTTYKELKPINHKLKFNIFIAPHQGQWGFKRRQKDAQWIVLFNIKKRNDNYKMSPVVGLLHLSSILPP